MKEHVLIIYLASSLEILNVIMSGGLAFDILDRLIGEWSALEYDWGRKIFSDILQYPFGWLILNVLFWGIIVYIFLKFMKKIELSSSSVITFRYKINRLINLKNFNDYLSTKPIAEEDVNLDRKFRIRKVSWVEINEDKWNACPPRIELQYDEMNNYLLTAFFQISKNNKKVKEDSIKQIFNDELKDYNVFLEEIEYRKAVYYYILQLMSPKTEDLD